MYIGVTLRKLGVIYTMYIYVFIQYIHKLYIVCVYVYICGIIIIRKHIKNLGEGTQQSR